MTPTTELLTDHRSSRLADFFHSIRFRLTLWFVLVLGLVLFVFSSIVYTAQMQSIRSQAAARLDIRAREMGDTLRRGLHNLEDDNSSALLTIPTSGSYKLDSQEVLILTHPTGQFAGGRGPIDDSTATQIISQAAAQNNDNKLQPGGRAFSYSLKTELAGKETSVVYLFESAPIGYENRMAGWMIIGQPVDPQGQLDRLGWILALTSLATLLLSLAGGYWLADRALSPVKTITRAAQEISESDLSRRLNIHNRDELGQLANTFDHMLDRLQAAFTRQRQFTADASHELRTPLTIIGLETDRALAVRRSPEEYQGALRVVRSENQFMVHLVSELLTLARMDSGQVNLKHDRLDLSDLALEVVERYTSIASRKGITLETGDLPEIFIQGDRQYLIHMIGNLVDNAIKYNPACPNQWVKVETGKSAGEPEKVWIKVSDNGPGIAADHQSHLFDRFYRVDQARSHNPNADSINDIREDEIPGSGLGLSIVQWIAQMHNGEVSVISQLGQGAVFEIGLPEVKPE